VGIAGWGWLGGADSAVFGERATARSEKKKGSDVFFLFGGGCRLLSSAAA
jgi:hypothetical protein